jgi:hypothetical protein
VLVPGGIPMTIWKKSEGPHSIENLSNPIAIRVEIKINQTQLLCNEENFSKTQA